jgi:hypothetical protein
VPPSTFLRRIDEEMPVAEMLEVHRQFLAGNGLSLEDLVESSPEELPRAVGHSLQREIMHNVHVGVLACDSENQVRYTVRGMFFLWAQFLRDLVRL